MIRFFGNGTAVAVGSTATAVRDTSITSREGSRYIQVTVPEDATESIFLGNAGVTIETGIEVKAGESWSSGDEVHPLADIYAIAATGPVNVRVLETR